MTASGDLSLLDLLDLPDPQRELLLWLARHGPADAASLAHSADLDPALTQQALADLIDQGHIQRLADGRVDAVAGRVRSRTTLPAHLWNALLATERHYSEQDVVTLRTAIPILQLARAHLIKFADHGPGHALRVKSYAGQLGCLVGLSEVEHGLLRAAALFHDTGNIVDRGQHHVISQETVMRLTAGGVLPFAAQEAEVVGLLCRWHRREYEPGRTDELDGRTIRTGLLASILRVADAMDIDHRRSDYTARWTKVIDFFFSEERPYWTSLEEILGVRIQCTPAVELQVFTQGDVSDNLQIALLRKDLAGTPLPWTLRQVPVPGDRCDDLPGLEWAPKRSTGSALLAFPFEPHSVVMAALSRKHLAAAGYGVELLCYPDTAGGPSWLWSEVLPGIAPQSYGRLVVVGDRSDPAVTPYLLQTVSHWQEAGVPVSVLNRHEASWTRLPALLQRGAEVVLGGDWSYFWGEPAGQQDLAWGRIAALCTRDPAQSTLGVAAEVEAVTKGLLKTVYDAACRQAADTDGWAVLVRPILERIEADDRAFFSEQAAGFAAAYAAETQPGRVEGRVLLFEGAPGQAPQYCYWALEAAIERQGRSPERGIHFKVPYAIATWRDADMVELLAINHWREEEAAPIRLLYPGDLGPPPAGNEGTVQVRLPASQAERVVQALLDACNQ
jgi:exopolyphosphatase / guanosine-5'-triphosphate,3'-diphosphate pyrophosphatase